MFAATVVADSISDENIRLTTLELSYPRFIHSELMTHRMFSRNASSSRAIPIDKMIEQVKSHPAMPVHWGRNQPGMQASVELTGTDRQVAEDVWRAAALEAAKWATSMRDLGVHKQVANRLLEPFQWMKTIVTATAWENFFALRCHSNAQPEFQHLATLMREARERSKPTRRKPEQWHLPYIKDEERYAVSQLDQIKCSVARCARVSYLNHDQSEPKIELDLALHDRLLASNPIHASPAEHQATPDVSGYSNVHTWGRPHLHGNLLGWCQYRKFVEHRQPAIESQLRAA